MLEAWQAALEAEACTVMLVFNMLSSFVSVNGESAVVQPQQQHVQCGVAYSHYAWLSAAFAFKRRCL
jgi:hypothetical protein